MGHQQARRKTLAAAGQRDKQGMSADGFHGPPCRNMGIFSADQFMQLIKLSKIRTAAICIVDRPALNGTAEPRCSRRNVQIGIVVLM